MLLMIQISMSSDDELNILPVKTEVKGKDKMEEKVNDAR